METRPRKAPHKAKEKHTKAKETNKAKELKAWWRLTPVGKENHQSHMRLLKAKETTTKP